MVDVKEQISAVRRRVGSTVLAAGEARVITISQCFAAGTDEVWDACTNPERIPRWFMPISGDLRLGGHYQLEGNASGTVERCDPPTSFAATWEYGGQVSWIEVRLTTEPDGATRFTLEHTAHVDDQLWAQFGPGAVGIGWDMGMLGLAGHLTGGGAVDPSEGLAWMLSAEGIEFTKASSLAWCEASIEGGTDATEARAAAERVTAAYTTPPEQAEH